MDPAVFECLGVKALGHRLLLAKGIVALNESKHAGRKDFRAVAAAAVELTNVNTPMVFRFASNDDQSDSKSGGAPRPSHQKACCCLKEE